MKTLLILLVFCFSISIYGETKKEYETSQIVSKIYKSTIPTDIFYEPYVYPQFELVSGYQCFISCNIPIIRKSKIGLNIIQLDWTYG